MSLEPPQNGVGNSGFEPLGREEQSGALPPANTPVARAFFNPLCVEPRTLPMRVNKSVDDGPIAYPDTMKYTPTTQVRSKL